MKVDSKDIEQVARLRAQRIAQGMCQSDIAHVFGVNRKTVQRWESPTNLGFPHEDELERMEEAFTGFLTGVCNITDSILESGGIARLWRSQEFWEAAGHGGNVERQNQKVVMAAIALHVSGKVDWDDLQWEFGDYPEYRIAEERARQESRYPESR